MANIVLIAWRVHETFKEKKILNNTSTGCIGWCIDGVYTHASMQTKLTDMRGHKSEMDIKRIVFGQLGVVDKQKG